MDVIDAKSDKQLIESLIAEIAKANNELKCARGDVEKAQGRISIFDAVRALVLDEEGNPVLTDGETLPTKIMMRVVQKVVENMGKL
jgi:hypothetical protein